MEYMKVDDLQAPEHVELRQKQEEQQIRQEYLLAMKEVPSVVYLRYKVTPGLAFSILFGEARKAGAWLNSKLVIAAANYQTGR